VEAAEVVERQVELPAKSNTTTAVCSVGIPDLLLMVLGI
jgi:hypothetical protein